MKEIIKNNFLQEVNNSNLKSELSETCCNKIIDEVCNLSLDCVYAIDKRQTQLLRKRLGVFDKGKMISIKKIAETNKMPINNITTEIVIIMNNLLLRFYNVPDKYLKDAIDYKDLPFKTMDKETLLNLKPSPIFFNSTFNCFEGKWNNTLKEIVELDINDVYAKCWKNRFLIDWIHSLGLSFKMDKLILEKDDIYKKELTIKELLDYNLLYLKGYFSNELYYDVLGKTIYDNNMELVHLNTLRNILKSRKESILNLPNVTKRTMEELEAFINSLNLEISYDDNKGKNMLLKVKK